jgi:hypothetical protein
MSNDVRGDALLIQHKETVGSTHSFTRASAIIRRIDTPTGSQWMFNNLMCIADTPLPCGGVTGGIAEVVTAARYQLGNGLFLHHDFFPVRYTDVSFPQHLVPSKD